MNRAIRFVIALFALFAILSSGLARPARRVLTGYVEMGPVELLGDTAGVRLEAAGKRMRLPVRLEVEHTASGWRTRTVAFGRAIPLRTAK